MMKPSRGFTIIELLVVVGIIAILASIGLPAYRDYVTRGKLIEAFNGLSDLRVRMEQYFQDNRKYNSGATTNCGAAMPSSRYFTFACTTGADPAQTYSATATGVVGEGTNGFVFTINEANARGTTTVGTNWNGAGSTCWVRKSDGSC